MTDDEAQEGSFGHGLEGHLWSQVLARLKTPSV